MPDLLYTPQRGEILVAIMNDRRDNALKVAGWTILRFNSKRIQEQVATYCLSTVSEKINKLGGLDEGGWVPRKIDPAATAYQPSLSD